MTLMKLLRIDSYKEKKVDIHQKHMLVINVKNYTVIQPELKF